MINEEQLKELLEKLKTIVVGFDSLIYPVRNIYDEHPEIEGTNNNA